MATINDMIELKINPDLITDQDLKKKSYAIQNFEFWGCISQEDRNYWKETKKILLERLRVLNEKPIVKTEIMGQPIIVIKEKLHTQVWEDCHCGNQPIYMSHGCCAKCAR